MVFVQLADLAEPSRTAPCASSRSAGWETAAFCSTPRGTCSRRPGRGGWRPAPSGARASPSCAARRARAREPGRAPRSSPATGNALPLRRLRGRRCPRSTSVVTGIPVQVCAECGRAAFPNRLACPACGSRDLRTELVRNGMVEQRTQRRAAATRSVPALAPPASPAGIASIRTQLGPALIAWSPDDASPRSEVELSLARPGVPVATARGTPMSRPLSQLKPAQRAIPRVARAPPSSLDTQCLDIGGRTLTFARLCSAVAGHAGTLARTLGSRPAIRLPSWRGTRGAAPTFLGAAWLGAISVPVNPAARGPQLKHVLLDSAPRLAAIDQELLDALAAVPDLPASSTASGRSAVGFPEAGAGGAASRSRATEITYPPGPVSPGQMAALLYTSGTTGPAKGVLSPTRSSPGGGRTSDAFSSSERRRPLHLPAALYHVNALKTFMQALVTGCRAVVGPRFSASRFWERVAASGATVTYLLGRSCRSCPAGIAAERGHRVASRSRRPVPRGLDDLVPGALRRAARRGVRHDRGQRRDRPARPAGGAGRWAARCPASRGGRRRADVDQSRRVAGELVLRADEPYAFATGTGELPEETLAAWRNLWFHTGDRVVRDADGSYHFVDRLKDAIRRRGENISAWEVEQALLAHPASPRRRSSPCPPSSARTR